MSGPSAKDLADDLVKRGAASHVRDIQLLINKLERWQRAANYTAGTGKLHHDEEKAERAVRRAYSRLMMGDV